LQARPQGVPTAGAGAPGARPSGHAEAIGPDDPRYADLVLRGNNRRFVATPEAIYRAGSTGQVVRAVEEAVRAGKRIAVRGGGHCFENFVDDDLVKVILDLSALTEVPTTTVTRPSRSVRERRSTRCTRPSTTLGCDRTRWRMPVGRCRWPLQRRRIRPAVAAVRLGRGPSVRRRGRRRGQVRSRPRRRRDPGAVRSAPRPVVGTHRRWRRKLRRRHPLLHAEPAYERGGAQRAAPQAAGNAAQQRRNVFHHALSIEPAD
jgi:hypothetical protein